MTLQFEVDDETPVARAIRFLQIADHRQCEYGQEEPTDCDETPGLGIVDWCESCRIREVVRILRTVQDA